MKSGKFGHYIVYNNGNYSINKDISHETISLDDAINIINTKNTSILRTFNDRVSIRNGAYGMYIMNNKTFIQLPKTMTIDTINTMTLDECLLIKHVKKTAYIKSKNNKITS